MFYITEYVKSSMSNQKRIMYLTQGRELYGSQRQLLHLVQNIDKDMYTPLIVHTEPMDFHGFVAVSPNSPTLIELRPWRKLQNSFLRYIDAYKLLRWSKHQDISLIHCSYQWLYPYALFIGRKLKIPIVLHIRRPGTISENEIGKNKAYAKADAIIAISKRIYGELQRIDTLSKMTYCIDDAVDDVFFEIKDSLVLRDEFGVKGGLLFGIVGRIYKSKRQLDFVMAAHQLLEKGIDAHFFIVGKIDDQKYYQKILSYIRTHELSNRIFFTGHRENMPEVLSSLDVLISLSGGSVMYEAMACGKAVISAGFTQRQDSVHVQDGVTGLVTESKSISQLTGLMEKIANDDELRNALGINARHRVVSHLGCKELALKTQHIYDRLLSP